MKATPIKIRLLPIHRNRYLLSKHQQRKQSGRKKEAKKDYSKTNQIISVRNRM